MPFDRNEVDAVAEDYRKAGLRLERLGIEYREALEKEARKVGRDKKRVQAQIDLVRGSGPKDDLPASAQEELSRLLSKRSTLSSQLSKLGRATDTLSELGEHVTDLPERIDVRDP